MAWKISVSLERDPEALLVVQRMIYAAVKAQGATDLEAYSAARSLGDAIYPTDMQPPEAEATEHQRSPVQIDLEYDEESLVVLVRDRRLTPNVPGSAAVH
jgi:hypothetical protein